MKKIISPIYIYIGLSILIGLCAINFSINLKYSAIFSEYFIKYLPALSDGNIWTIFDINLIGDPRPRYFSSLLEFSNILIRKILFVNGLYYPTISINWIIYPTTIYLLYLTTKKIYKNNEITFSATILFACSSGMLDMLCNFYIPSKPLILLLVVMTLFFWAKFFEKLDSSRNINIFIASLTLLLALFSDETAIFIYLMIISIFITNMKKLKWGEVSWLLFISAIPLLIFILIANSSISINKYPFFSYTGNFFTLVIKGIHTSIFEIDQSSINEFSILSPQALFEIILSKFFVPNLQASGSWTSSSYPGFLSFSASEKLLFIMSVCLCLILYFNLKKSKKIEVCKLFIGLIIFCILQSILLLPLSTFLVDINYYAGLSNLWICLIMGVLIGGTSKNFLLLPSKIFLIFIVLTSLVNFEKTASRNPFLSNPIPTYSDISRIVNLVKSNSFSTTINSLPEFPNRLFSYAYEMEILKKSSLNQKVDLEPYKTITTSTLSFLPKTGVQDDLLYRSDAPSIDAKFIYSSNRRRLSSQDVKQLFSNRKIRGSSGSWRYIRTFDSKGDFIDKAWFEGITRQWTLTGNIIYNENLFCFDFSNGALECLHQLYYVGNQTYYGLGSNNTVVTVFKTL